MDQESNVKFIKTINNSRNNFLNQLVKVQTKLLNGRSFDHTMSKKKKKVQASFSPFWQFSDFL